MNALSLLQPLAFSLPANLFLHHWGLYLLVSLMQLFPWNTLSRNICSKLQSNYNITKSFIITLLNLNVKKFDFPIQSFQFNFRLLHD